MVVLKRKFICSKISHFFSQTVQLIFAYFQCHEVNLNGRYNVAGSTGMSWEQGGENYPAYTFSQMALSRNTSAKLLGYCADCPYGRYQDERGFNGTSCKECQDGYIPNADKTTCINVGADPVPNGNGGCGLSSCGQTSADRAGTLGGLVDDYLGMDKIKKDTIITKYGFIEHWDVSQVTNMMSLFYLKETMNSDIRQVKKYFFLLFQFFF